MKRCTKCGMEKALDEFDVERRVSDGRTAQCKRCRLDVKNACRQQHPERQREYNRQYYSENQQRMIERSRAYREANPDKVRESFRRWCAENPEKMKAACQRWLRNNMQHKLEYNRRYKREHGLNALYTKKRRSIKKAAGNGITRKQWEQLQESYGFRCAYCETKNERLTQDHVIPLSAGGAHSIENIVPACAHCNSQKRTAPPPEGFQLSVAHLALINTQ